MHQYEATVAAEGELPADEVAGLDEVAAEQLSADDELWAVCSNPSMQPGYGTPVPGPCCD